VQGNPKEEDEAWKTRASRVDDGIVTFPHRRAVPESEGLRFEKIVGLP